MISDNLRGLLINYAEDYLDDLNNCDEFDGNEL